MATLPTRKVEIEFDVGVWTDVGADLVSLSTRRGRNRESGAFETGTMQVTLRNDTRKYDPDHAAGPYYGKLRPNRRIRLRATYNAVTYDVWLGYIDRITQVYGGPNDAAATIDASDFFKILNRIELPDSVFTAEVLADAPVHWWRLSDPAGSTTARDELLTQPGTYTGTYTLGGPGLVVRDTTTSANINGPAGELRTGYSIPANDYTIEFWFSTTADSTTTDALIAADGQDTFTLKVVGTGGANAGKLSDWLGTIGTRVVTDGAPHHVALVRTAAGVQNIYLDGTLEFTHNPVFTGAEGPVRLSPDTVVATSIIGKTAVFQDLVIYTSALSSTRVAAHNSAGRTPWNGDLPGTRLVRIFDIAGGGSYVIDAGTTTLQSTSLGGSVLAYAQKVEETEAGRLFVARNGDVTFIGRQTAETGAYLTPKATLVDDDSGAGRPYRYVSADVDEATIVTRATVSREGSVAVTYTDSAGIVEFKTIDETHDGLLHNDDTYSENYAEWIVNTHKTPRTRLGTITLELPIDPVNMYPAFLPLELADRLTYKRKPQNVGAVFTQDMRVEAISHETGPHYWTTRLQLSPFYLTASNSLWILEVAGYSELGQTTTLGL